MRSFRLPIDAKSRVAGRLIAHVRDQLQKALIEEKASRKLTQQQIANTIGVDRASVNRQFNGAGNLTLRSIAELAWALNRNVVFGLEKPIEMNACNHPTSMTSSGSHFVAICSSTPETLTRSGTAHSMRVGPDMVEKG